MLSDLTFIFIWWLTIFCLGLLSLPFIFLIFKNFFDKGYIFSKIFSISIITYSIFVLSFFKILFFNELSLYLIIFLFLSFDLFFLFYIKKYQWFFSILKQKYKIFIFEELLFLFILLFWSFVRGFVPDIEGLEKFMDWGFINSALRSQFLPPVDMWFSGQTINYYYFGHLIFAVLTKLSKISSAITYNLAVATICSLTFVSSFSLASNFIFIFLNKNKNKIYLALLAGLISALFLTFGGNLHTVYKLSKTKPLTKAIDSYWYPDATRFIGYDPDTKDKTIHEFPCYSFTVADLHGHMNDIVIVIFFVAFLFSFLLTKNVFFDWKANIFLGFILSLSYMTNAWDFAIYGLLFALTFFFISLYQKNFKNAFFATLLNGLSIICFWFLFSLPFSLKFVPIGDGLGLSDFHTPFYQLFILYGGFWLICLPFVIYFLYLLIKNFKLKIKNYISPVDIFVFSLIITATLLVIIPEFFYIKDIYSADYRRANTMFKLVYEAFIMYSLCSGYILIRFSQSLKNSFFVWLYKIVFFLIFLCHLIYPFFAVKSFYSLKKYQGLWGLNFLKNSNPDNFAAVEWINKNIKGQPVMVEAVGDSYTTFNQISVATGLPTIEGWVVHEWLWRGGYSKPAARQEEVKTIYESKDLPQIKKIIEKYSVRYIFVGDKEYEKYPNLDEKKFEQIGKIIFQSGNTKIYKLN